MQRQSFTFIGRWRRVALRAALGACLLASVSDAGPNRVSVNVSTGTSTFVKTGSTSTYLSTGRVGVGPGIVVDLPPATRFPFSVGAGAGESVFDRFYFYNHQLYYAKTPYFWIRYKGRVYRILPYRSTTYWWPVYGMNVRLNQQGYEPPMRRGASESAPAPQPEVDEALEAMRDGDYNLAATLYRRRGDTRLEALARLGERRYKLAVELFAEAYGADRDLTSEPIKGVKLLGSRHELRRVTGRLVSYAHYTDTAEAWFAVAVMMRAGDRYDNAHRMMERARTAEDEGRGRIPIKPVDVSATSSGRNPTGNGPA